jgi:hypothetical protein
MQPDDVDAAYLQAVQPMQVSTMVYAKTLLLSCRTPVGTPDSSSAAAGGLASVYL